eukprot:224415_1
MGAAAPCEDFQQENEDIEATNVDIAQANQEYIEQFEHLDENKDADEFAFYSIDNHDMEQKTNDDSKTMDHDYRFNQEKSSRSKQQCKITGMTRTHIESYINHGGLLVNTHSSHRRLKNGRSMERSCQVSCVQILINSDDSSKVKLIGTVKSQLTPNKEYNISVQLKECLINKNNQVIITSIKNIEASDCNCDDVYGDFIDNNHKKKCKHIVALCEGVREEHVTESYVPTAKSEEYFKGAEFKEENEPYYLMGDCVFPLHALPSGFAGPSKAFAYKKVAYILSWLMDIDYKKSNLAAIFIWMYIWNGAINSIAHLCPHVSCTKKNNVF